MNSVSGDKLFDAVVQDLASDGRGIVQHPNGFVVFVAGVWLGERVRIELVDRKRKFGNGLLVEVLESSPDRIDPPCRYHGHSKEHCGGCPWQFISYTAQLEAKQSRVETTLTKIGVKYRISVIQPSEKNLGYRNRAQLKTNGSMLGFVANASSELIDVEDCPVLTDKNRESLKSLRTCLPNVDWQPALKANNKSNKWTTLDIDESVNAETVSVNRRLPFRQGNDSQNQYMRNWLSEKLSKIDKIKTVLELFSGDGNFTQVIADSGFKKIVAADIAGDAIQCLSDKAMPQVTTMVMDLFDDEAVARLLKSSQPDVLVLDPPRDGLRSGDDVFKNNASLEDILYVSCDLATLGRDLKQFLDNDYKVREVQPLDMFPHTPHIETLVHLRKRQR